MKTKYRNIAFLVELLINILVFSVSCAILVGLFGAAGRLARETKEESYALDEIYALVQPVKLGGAEALPEAEANEGSRRMYYYNSDWEPVDTEGADYVISLDIQDEPSSAGVLHTIAAVASDRTGREICRLDTAAYRPDEGGAA